MTTTKTTWTRPDLLWNGDAFACAMLACEDAHATGRTVREVAEEQLAAAERPEGRRAIIGEPESTFATFAGACPVCKAEPFRARGGGKRIEGHDTYAADGRCADCGEGVGTIRARVDTLFGLEEDEAVLVHGRPRVY